MMIHILKLIRSRAGGSGWILAELLVVFVVIWFMTGYFLMMGKLRHEPVGYDLDGVYQAVLATRASNSPSFVAYEEGGDGAARDVERIVERLRRHPGVEAVGLSVSSLPYALSTSGSRARTDSVTASVRMMMVSPGYFRVFGIRPVSGGSPEELGEALSRAGEGKGRVISAGLAKRLYGTTDAIGAGIYLNKDTLPGSVIAVTGPVRNDEFDRRNQCCVFSLLDLREQGNLRQAQITFRVRPDAVTADYADRLMKEMRRQLMAGNFRVSEIRDYREVRASFMENSLYSSAQRIVSALGLFLLTNVFLAVIGTFWFHVSRRRPEVGLRMAVGSTRASVLGLVMGEGLMLLTIATVPALLICANLAWLDLMPPGLVESKLGCFLINSLLTWLILALIIILATWYPSRKASSLEPADALRYDG
ncbi:MAG: FtsX-like permease family protein [Parabacteroides sp.]|nr:FtsX-like permease family protein [Parabacteroides sp.]